MRLVVNQIASLKEIETHWSIIDVLNVNESFDLKIEADNRMIDKQIKEAKR